MIMLSASALWRAEKCPASASLPRVARLHADAEAGTEAHADHEAACPPDEMAEAAFALNPETGKARFLGQGLKRDYPVDWSVEIPGTVDRMKRAPIEGVAEVRDFKSGFGFMVAPADRNLQLAHNSLCVADVQGVDTVRVALDRPEAPGKPVTFDALALAEARERIRKIWRSVNDPTPQVVTGDHCWRCECFSRCPAQRELALVVATGKLPAELPVLELTRDAVGIGWPRLMQFKKLLGEVERVYRAFASEEPVPLGPGRWLGPVTKRTEELDGTVTANVLRQLHGPEVAAQACEVSTSKAAIERAIAPIAARGQKAGMMRRVLDEIAAAGGVQPKFRKSVEEYDGEEQA